MRALAFDVFGTLFDVEALQKTLRGHGAKGEDLLPLWRNKQLEYTFILALMDRFLIFSEVTRRALIAAASQLHVGLGQEEVHDLTRAWERLPLYPETIPALEALTERYTLVVLSNGDMALLRSLLETSGTTRLFSRVLSAEEVGAYKPSPDVYELAVRRLQLPPAEIGMVSSNAFDIMGAKAFGLKALWVNRSGREMDPLDLQPDLEARDFGELTKLLGEAGIGSGKGTRQT